MCLEYIFKNAHSSVWSSKNKKNKIKKTPKQTKTRTKLNIYLQEKLVLLSCWFGGDVCGCDLFVQVVGQFSQVFLPVIH